VAELDEPWRSTVRDARADDPAALRAHVERVIAAGALAAHASDVVLAWNVARGDPRALEQFEREIASEIAGAVRRIDRDAAFVDEVRQRVRVRLLVGDGDTAPRIASYRGTGPLRGWVAIAAMRVALNAKRDGRVGGAQDDVLADLVDREPDPELRHLKTLYRTEFREVLVAAIAALGDRERALLRMRFVSGLELAQIGKLYRVHESTASRWIAAALAAIGKDARARLVARLSVTPETADSVARMVASQLDLSIARLLE
jgi:RNA polymerase sigma-70 factor (ECF subfamily)